DSLAGAVRNEYPGVELIAGVATGAIAPGVLVAERLQLPFVYVRSTPKAHGLGARVEGFAAEGLKTVVIEDLVSTAGSSILACDALKADKLKVLGMAAIFTYDLDMAEQNLKKAGIPLITLSNYHDLVWLAKSKGMITDEEQAALMQWRLNPSSWSDARQHN
ncbi:MAG: phosphoribosyltransferase family protein, partial [Bacteroidales bacterium]|nr:phosphoribosyltransferase family protein [Bacteroidales bacterium]